MSNLPTYDGIKADIANFRTVAIAFKALVDECVTRHGYEPKREQQIECLSNAQDQRYVNKTREEGKGETAEEKDMLRTMAAISSKSNEYEKKAYKIDKAFDETSISDCGDLQTEFEAILDAMAAPCEQADAIMKAWKSYDYDDPDLSPASAANTRKRKRC